MDKTAFTLAEVLITLGIIGIVAAMTLPALTGKYQQKVLASQFKKAYANLQTAINTVNTQNGIPYECYTIGFGGYHYDGCNEFWPAFLEQFKSAKLCGNWKNKHCRASYKSKEEVISEGGTIANSACSHDIDSYEAYNLNDGSIIYLYNSPDSEYNTHTSLFFAFDVNGIKGPNRWGYDLFYLNLCRKNEKAPVLGLTFVCELTEKGGQSAEDILLK